MVKAVQAEERVSVYIDGLLSSRVQAEVGLLVGKPNVGSRDIVLAAIPSRTPDGEKALTVTARTAAAPAKQKKGAGRVAANEPAVSIQLDSECIAEHALEVSRMLPGGLSVLGVYLFSPESGYSSASSSLCQTLVSIAEDASRAAAASASTAAAAAVTASVISATYTAASAPPQELLLLHIDSTSRKFNMRSCQVSSAAVAASTLKPCELKFGSSLPSLMCLQCNHTFDFTVPASSTAVQLQQLLQEAVAAECARVAAAVAVLNGHIQSSSSQSIAELLPSSTSNKLHIQLYCLPHASTALQSSGNSTGNSTGSCDSSSFLGSSRLHGSVTALAYVHKRDPVGKALAELKMDVINSLKVRMQLLEDDALAAAEDAKEAAAEPSRNSSSTKAPHPLLVSLGSSKHSGVAFARRVLLPWNDTGLQVCCYLADDETLDVAVEHAEQQMQLTGIQVSEIVECESPAMQKPKIVAGAVVRQEAPSNSAPCSAAVVGAAAAGLAAAVAVGVAYLNMGQ